MKIGKYKVSLLQLTKLFIQIVFFIFLPILYINTFNGIKQIYISIIHQSFNWSNLLPQLVETFAIIPITIIAGRFFCGWMCAFGAFTDFIFHISNKIFKVKFNVNEKTDRMLKYVKYALLLFLISVTWSFNTSLLSSTSPWDVFGMIATIGKKPDFSYSIKHLTAGFIFLIIIIIASAFIERFFCKYLCPLGAIFAIISKLRVSKISKDRTQCGNCRICTNNCVMGIPLYKHDIVKSGDCINCLKCIQVCPRKNVTLAVAENDIRPLVAGTVAVATITGIYCTGAFALNSSNINTTTATASAASSSQTSSNKLYNDGTYQGSGTGFRGGTTTVSVTVENDKITDISIISSGDDKKFFNRAFSKVKQEIISEQATNVDAVSGATFSSNGIMDAVANALNQAKLTNASSQASSKNISTSSSASTTPSNSIAVSQSGSSSVSPSSTPASSDYPSASSPDSSSSSSSNSTSGSSSVAPQASSPASSSSSASVSPSSENDKNTNSVGAAQQSQNSSSASTRYKDGTYQGSGTGFRGGTTTVSVTVENDKITNISAVSYRDDRPYFNRAFSTIKQEIISEQTSDVDAVSGATFSSNGIMSAVANALSKAES